MDGGRETKLLNRQIFGSENSSKMKLGFLIGFIVIFGLVALHWESALAASDENRHQTEIPRRVIETEKVEEKRAVSRYNSLQRTHGDGPRKSLIYSALF